MSELDEQAQGNEAGKDGLRKEIQERFKATFRHYQNWEKVAKEDYKFALGDQWSTEDLNILEGESRPALTFNRIRPLINLVSGYQRENSARIKVNPEGGEDQVFSDVMDRGLSSMDKWSHLTYKLGYWFDDGMYCGKGWIEAILKYDKDPIRGQLDFKQRTPYQIKVDPECNDYDINEGAEYAFKLVRLTKNRLKELYPGHDKLIDGFKKDTDDRLENGDGLIGQEGADDDYGNRPNVTTVVKETEHKPEDESQLEMDGKFTVKEYWRLKMVDKYFVINNEDGEPERFDDKEEAETWAAQQAEKDGKKVRKAIKRPIPEMWVAAFVAGFVLQDVKSPFEPHYSGFPFFRFLADWAPNAETEVLRVQGFTRPLKDPQREKNKAKSQHLHILNTQSNSGWIGDDNALSPTGWDLLEKLGSKPGINIRKKPGTELREIQPKGIAAGHIQREQAADEEFTQIAGVNPDLLGFQDGTQSGKAISLRIRQAILALVRLFTNYRYSKEILGLFMLKMMPSLFDEKKLMKVLGPKFLSENADKDKYPDGLNEGHVKAFLQMVKDNKYDVLVTEADHSATIRFETFQELSELLKAGAPIPVDLLLDFMDIPNAEEIKKRVKDQQDAILAANAQKPKKGKAAPAV